MSHVTLIKPTTILQAGPILWALIRAPKGPHEILYIDGWEVLSMQQRAQRLRHLKKLKRTLKLPYTLHWRGWLCWWRFDNPEWQTERDWFDRNAEEGHYPEIASYHPERETV